MAWPSGWSLMTFKKPTSVSWSSRDHSSPPQAQVENQITHLLSAHVCTHIRHTHTQTLNFLQDQQEAKEAGKIFRPFPFHSTHLQKTLTCFTRNSQKSDSTPIGVQFFLRGGLSGKWTGSRSLSYMHFITLKKLTQGEGLIE